MLCIYDTRQCIVAEVCILVSSCCALYDKENKLLCVITVNSPRQLQAPKRIDRPHKRLAVYVKFSSALSSGSLSSVSIIYEITWLFRQPVLTLLLAKSYRNSFNIFPHDKCLWLKQRTERVTKCSLVIEDSVLYLCCTVTVDSTGPPYTPSSVTNTNTQGKYSRISRQLDSFGWYIDTSHIHKSQLNI